MEGSCTGAFGLLPCQQELLEATDLLLAKVRKMCEDISNLPHEEAMRRQLRSQETDALLAALNIYQNEPGILELKQQFQCWITKHTKVLVYGDFMAFASECKSQDIADLSRLEALAGKLHALTAPDDAEFRASVQVVVRTSLIALMAEAMMNINILKLLAVMKVVWGCGECCGCGGCGGGVVRCGGGGWSVVGVWGVVGVWWGVVVWWGCGEGVGVVGGVATHH